MRLTPMNNCVITTQIVENTFENTLFCPNTNSEVITAKVESSNNENVKVGDKIIFFKFCACPYTLNTKNFFIVNFDDIIAKLEDEKNGKQKS